MLFGKFRRSFVCILGSIFVILSVSAAAAQDITLTILVPMWMQDIYSGDLFSDFESQHPGVGVVLARDSGVPGISSAVYDPDSHLDTVERYAQAADVVFISSEQWGFSIEATRAGNFLDLAPLVASDVTLNPDDFFAPIWQSYQWDGGIWVLPFSARVVLLSYDVDALNEAGGGAGRGCRRFLSHLRRAVAATERHRDPRTLGELGAVYRVD